MKKISILVAVTVSLLVVRMDQLKAQSVAINTDGTVAHSSAMLDVKSTTKGLLAPRMTQAQRDLISSPAAGLLIFQTDNTPGYYYYNGSAWIQFSTGSATNFWTLSGNNIFNNNAGNVGIGTSNPVFKLTIHNAGFGLLHTDGTVRLSTYVGDNGVGPDIYGGWLGTTTNHPLMFFTNNGNPQMMIKQNGNIGIGVTNPAYLLDVGNRILLRSGPTPNESSGILLNNPSNSITHAFIGTAENNKIGFYGYTGAGWGLVMNTTNGNVGIGTLTPANKLTVLTADANYGLTHTNGSITVGSYVGFGAGWLGTKTNNPLNFFTNDGGAQMVLQTDGSVQMNGPASINGGPGVNFTSGNDPKLTVNGIFTIKSVLSPYQEWQFQSSNINTLFVNLNGNQKAYVDNDGDWNSTSDARLKENILPYKSVLGDIKNLKISTYRYKSNAPDSRSFGLIAQNVAQYFPEIVSETQDKEGNKLLGIAYGKTGVLALKAIQEQQVIIEKQQQQIEYLVKELQLIKEKLK